MAKTEGFLEWYFGAVLAERIVITLAKDYIMNRTSFKCGADYRKAIEKAVAKIN